MRAKRSGGGRGGARLSSFPPPLFRAGRVVEWPGGEAAGAGRGDWRLGAVVGGGTDGDSRAFKGTKATVNARTRTPNDNASPKSYSPDPQEVA